MAVQATWSAVRRFLFWAIPVILVATLVWTFLPHGGTAPPASSQARPVHEAGNSRPPSPGSSPYAQIQQGDLEGIDDGGHERWRIVADEVTVVENKETVLLRNVQATFFQNGGGTIIVTGARGRYDTKTHAVELNGNVHGKSTNGRELFADRLQWTPSSGRVTGSGHIKLLQQHVIMYADRLSSDTTLGETQFFGHVHAAAR
jgi:LPS export ABC transporter protein LptC